MADKTNMSCVNCGELDDLSEHLFGYCPKVKLKVTVYDI